ncbi:MAG: hypothetical protein AB7S38_07555 [Vulcanimicrobiota bacterium]
MRHLSILFLLLSAAALAQPDLGALGAEAGRLRELSYRKIPSSVVSQKQAADYVLKLLDAELDPDLTAAQEFFLKSLGLMPESGSIRTILRTLYASQVRGLYDPAKKRYIVVKDANLPDVGAALGLDLTDLFTVHELGHAIQDQHFDLEKIARKTATSTDASFAAQAVIEGDASLLMMDYAMGKLGISTEQLESLGDAGVAGMDPSLLSLSDPALASAPRYFREVLSAPYAQGMVFATALRKQGGWKAVDRALRQPPASSEQIYHPGKYLRGNDPPQKISLSRLPSSFGGYKSVAENHAGEFTVRILCQEYGASNFEAASGWGGDCYRAYARGKAGFVVWATVWDSVDDAQEFETLMTTGLTQLYGSHQAGNWKKKGRLYALDRRGSKVTLVLGVPEALGSTVKKAAL